ncbi:MAG TPA: hypothetical protein VIU64_19915 [Polyangia bacterium]
MRDSGALAGRLAFALTLAMTISACKRDSAPAVEPAQAPPAAAAPAAPPPAPTPAALEPAPGEEGPLGGDCYDTKQAKACPPDPSDPSGRKLAAHGGECHFPVCRPCGSETALAFRDEHGAPSAGYCICVPRSDSSGRGSLTCYDKAAWKRRSSP